MSQDQIKFVSTTMKGIL